MLAVDILHDWEIGAWKATFIHLIRILYAADAAQVNTLDARCVCSLKKQYFVTGFTFKNSFRSTPTFGRDTIRKFSANSSEMKKLAARDYEDILQVSAVNFEMGMD